MFTLRKRIEAAIEAGHSKAALARAAGVTAAAVTHWTTGESMNLKAKSALGLAQLTGWSVSWWTDGKGPREVEPASAHSVSQATLTIDPVEDVTVVKWGSMKAEALPEVFRVEVPDDAMADRVLKGHLVKFSTTIEPRAGDGVLVEDSTGAWFFRLYSPGAQGRFSAVAKNPAYQTLDSERDGLRVLAVLIGIPEARWG